jgi:hypothetical protein
MAIETIQPTSLGNQARPSRIRRLITSLSESLNDTSSFRRRREDSDDSSGGGGFRMTGNGINFPTVVFIFLLGQLVGAIWWGATMQSDVNHEVVDRAKQEGQLWQIVETYRLQVDQLRIDVARASNNCRP